MKFRNTISWIDDTANIEEMNFNLKLMLVKIIIIQTFSKTKIFVKGFEESR
jgi:hypothetical protein